MTWVFGESQTKGAERMILLVLADHADADGTCWPGIARIADHAGLTERHAKRTITAMVDKGLLVRSINGSPDSRMPGNRRPNLYRIVVPGVTSEPLGVTSTPVRGDSRYTQTKRRTIKEPRESSLRSDSLPESVDSGEPSDAPATLSAAQVRDVEFAEWYANWPRKVGKADARKAWEKLKPDADAVSALVEAQRHYEESRSEHERLYGEAPADVMFPATWLNGTWQDFAEGPTLERWRPPKVDPKRKAEQDLRSQLRSAMGEGTSDRPEAMEVEETA